jgi:hypothetical protein
LISSSIAASVLSQDDSLTLGPHRCGVADVLQVANGMVLRGGGSPVSRARWTWGRCQPILDGLDDSLAAHPDLIVSLNSVSQRMFS